jgi:iron complex outermembrane receptor protein
MRKLLLFSALLLSQIVIAQHVVTGVLVDKANEPLIGANVSVKGTSFGTITDVDGTFTIDARSADATLVFSYVGYTTREIALNGAKTLNVILTSGQLLDEVVFIGSRSEGRTMLTTAVPVDIINISEVTSMSPQVNLNQLLNYVAPSFTSNVQNIPRSPKSIIAT